MQNLNYRKILFYHGVAALMSAGVLAAAVLTLYGM